MNENMKYGTVPDVALPVSRLVFGCGTAPMIAGENVDELLDAVLAMGVNAFDTAENYGLSESSLGGWLKRRGIREQVVLITKGCHPYDGKDRVNPQELRKDLEQSFERLQTDYIDIYMLHRDDRKVSPLPVLEVLNAYHENGRIGAFGVSNWSTERIREAEHYAKTKGLKSFSVSSPHFGLCRQVNDPWGGGDGCVTITGADRRVDRKWYQTRNMPIFAYSSLGRGMLSGKIKSGEPEAAISLLDEGGRRGYACPENFERLARAEKLAAKKGCTVPQIALAWVLSQKLDVYALVSSTRAASMEKNVRALAVKLTPAEMRFLNLEQDTLL